MKHRLLAVATATLRAACGRLCRSAPFPAQGALRSPQLRNEGKSRSAGRKFRSAIQHALREVGIAGLEWQAESLAGSVAVFIGEGQRPVHKPAQGNALGNMPRDGQSPERASQNRLPPCDALSRAYAFKTCLTQGGARSSLALGWLVAGRWPWASRDRPLKFLHLPAHRFAGKLPLQRIPEREAFSYCVSVALKTRSRHRRGGGGE